MPQSSTASSLHAAVTNVATESFPVGERLLSPPIVGKAPEIAPLPNGVEALRGEIREESATELTAPAAQLPDIGAASFATPGLQLETVHGVDNRIQVSDTHQYPWSANASLLITARDGSQWSGTGWFVSPRTLVTAGHCVYIKNSGVPGRDGWVRGIQVMPGRNGTQLPLGSVTSSQFWTVKGWADNGDENYDYGAIIVPTEIGNRVGTLGFAAHGDEELAGVVVNVAGYPGDKPSGTMGYDTKGIASTSGDRFDQPVEGPLRHRHGRRAEWRGGLPHRGRPAHRHSDSCLWGCDN